MRLGRLGFKRTARIRDLGALVHLPAPSIDVLARERAWATYAGRHRTPVPSQRSRTLNYSLTRWEALTRYLDDGTL